MNAGRERAMIMGIKASAANLLARLRSEATTHALVSAGMVIGKNFSRQEKCLIDQSHCWLIKIGDDVTLAPRVHILAHDASTKKELGYTRIGLVTIGNRVFIGAGSIILPNVTIGDDVVIAAGSVVTKDIPSGCVAAGNPARVIGPYEEYINRKKQELKGSPVFDESYTLRNKEITQQQKKEMEEKLRQNGGVGYVE